MDLCAILVLESILNRVHFLLAIIIAAQFHKNGTWIQWENKK